VTPRRRWTLISLAAIATAIAAWIVPDGNQQVAEVAEPVQRAPSNTSVTSGSKGLGSQLPTREPIGRQRGDPFAPRSWTAPAKPQAQQAEDPRPPVNPYRFAGTVQQDGVRKVFLLLGDRVVEAKEGEMLEQGFRVKSVSADAVVLIYEQIPDSPFTFKLAFGEPPASAPAAARGSTSEPFSTIPPLGPPTR
jgi:hypothetical protein